MNKSRVGIAESGLSKVREHRSFTALRTPKSSKHGKEVAKMHAREATEDGTIETVIAGKVAKASCAIFRKTKQKGCITANHPALNI